MTVFRRGTQNKHNMVDSVVITAFWIVMIGCAITYVGWDTHLTTCHVTDLVVKRSSMNHPLASDILVHIAVASNEHPSIVPTWFTLSDLFDGDKTSYIKEYYNSSEGNNIACRVSVYCGRVVNLKYAQVDEPWCRTLHVLTGFVVPMVLVSIMLLSAFVYYDSRKKESRGKKEPEEKKTD